MELLRVHECSSRGHPPSCSTLEPVALASCISLGFRHWIVLARGLVALQAGGQADCVMAEINRTHVVLLACGIAHLIPNDSDTQDPHSSDEWPPEQCVILWTVAQVSVGSYPVSGQEDGAGIVLSLESKDVGNLEKARLQLLSSLPHGMVTSEERDADGYSRHLSR
jgi:hypothetical protein